MVIAPTHTRLSQTVARAAICDVPFKPCYLKSSKLKEEFLKNLVSKFEGEWISFLLL